MNSNMSFSIFNNQHTLQIFLIIQLLNIITNEIVERKSKKSINSKEKNTNEHMSKSDIKCLLVIAIFSIIAFIVVFFLFKLKLFFIVFNIINSLCLIYYLIICPILNMNISYNFKENILMVTSSLLTEMIIIDFFSKYSTLTSIFGTGHLLQIVLIFVIMIKTLLVNYFLLLCVYNIIKNLNILIIKDFNIYIDKYIIKINQKYNINYLFKLLSEKNYFIKKVSFLLIYALQCVFILLFIRTLLIVLNIFNNILLSIFNNNENKNFYIISKLSLIVSLFITYGIIIFSKSFDKSIIQVFEFISSTIIIPVILDMLLSRQKSKRLNEKAY